MSCCALTTLAYISLGIIVAFVLKKLTWSRFQDFNTKRMINRWSKTPKDVIILHKFKDGKTIPNPSPFVMKVETYLRMCGIKYETDISSPLGPKGKSPWISLNGEHIADSQLIVEFLSKKFEKSFSHNFTDEQLGIAKLIRICLEEHFLWGLALERFVFGKENLDKVLDFPLMFIFGKYMTYVINGRSKAQGIGLHSQDQIVKFMTTDLRAVSAALGSKKFICGDKPCEEDCAIFSFIAQCIWGLPNSPYELIVKGELKNLEQYCMRMREKFWPDWNEFLEK